MRGLFLVIIFADHLAYTPSLFFEFATGTSSAFASAAEGFFAISGILVGYIYGPRILQATKKTVLKIWRRAGLLYLLAVGFTLLFSAWAALLPHPYGRQPEWQGDAMGLVFNAMTLQFHFGWADFLARYAVFMAIAPLVVWLVAKGRARVVVFTSVVVWLLFRTQVPINAFTAWQLLFMFGIIIGYYLPQFEARAMKIRPNIRKYIWHTIVILAAASYAAIVIRLSILPFLFPSINNALPVSWLAYIDKDTLGIARIAIGMLWFSGLYLFFRRYEQQVDKLTYGTILLLGMNSLFVYSFEAFIIFAIDVFMPAPAQPPLFISTLVGIIGICIVYAGVRVRAHWQARGRIEV
jgi:hypothetical protein